MANCALFERGSDTITYFVRDCVKIGRTYQGSNCAIHGVKETLYCEKWTEDGALQREDGSWDRQVSDLAEARRFEGQVVSNKQDVNKVIQDKIREVYSAADEIQLLRLKLADPVKSSPEFDRYHAFVEGILSKARTFKTAHLKDEEAPI